MRELGLDVSVVGPTGVKLFDFLYSGIQLSPYLCFISFLYLDLYWIEDGTSIS